MFGTLQAGAIHGWLPTAWSTAAILGPTIVTQLRDYQVKAGVAAGLAENVAKANAHNTTMYIMASLLVVGFVCNLFVRPVAPRYHYKEEKNFTTRLTNSDAWKIKAKRRRFSYSCPGHLLASR